MDKNTNNKNNNNILNPRSLHKVFIYKNGVLICSTNMESNLYVLRPLTCKSIINTKMFKTAQTQHKRQKISLLEKV